MGMSLGLVIVSTMCIMSAIPAAARREAGIHGISLD
jgi:hypothetical protein